MNRLLIALIAAVAALPVALAIAADEPAPAPAPAADKPAEKPADAPADKPAEGEKPAPPKAISAPDIDTIVERVSYLIGVNMGAQLAQEGLSEKDLDLAMLQRGMADMLAGKDPAVTREDGTAAFQEFQKAMREKMQKDQDEAAAKNKAAGEKFLADNKAKEGVTTTASGLQYKVIAAGAGAGPTAADTVTVHYEGRLTDGTVFDSSIKRGEPATFPVSGVIKGWTEALQLMKPGAKYQLYIPSELAYGATGPGRGPIGPHAVLIFDVELIKVDKDHGAPEKDGK